jgi:hypothetical protein
MAKAKAAQKKYKIRKNVLKNMKRIQENLRILSKLQ